jgi:hypothetical protein
MSFQFPSKPFLFFLIPVFALSRIHLLKNITMVPGMKFYKLFFVSFCFVANGFAQSATILRSPTVSSSVPTGVGNGPWSTVSGVELVGGVNAISTTFTLDGQTSDNIITSNYGFTIPAGATILGIEAQVVRQTSLVTISNITDYEVRLLKAGVPVGFNQANQVGTWPELPGETAGVYGGTTTDLWASTWTPADINDPGFGLLFSAQRINVPGALDQNAFVNSIQLRIYYSDALPIVLRNFDIKKVSSTSSLISWVTEQEVNVKEYEVQRSANGVDFSTLGKIIPSSPNSNKEQKYSIQDNSPLSGKNYYRLKQTDLDGKFQIFDVKSISFDSKDEYFKVIQTASNRIKISSSNKKGSFSVQLRDTQGRLLQQQTIIIEGTINDTYLNLNPNVKGIVFVSIIGSQERQSFRQFIQ